MPLTQAIIPMNFRDDRCGCDRAASGVAVDKGKLLDREIEFHRVNQEVIGSRGRACTARCIANFEAW